MKGVEALNHNDLVNAKIIFKKLMKSKDSKIKHLAIESLAKIYLQENQNQKSYDLLLKADPQFLVEGKCLLCKLAFEQQNYELIGKYALEIYNTEPSHEIALLISKAFASLNQIHLADAWLHTASQFGADERQIVTLAK